MNYMKCSIVVLFCLAILTSVKAQEEIKPCGTPPIVTDWFKEYIKDRTSYSTGGDTVLYVPIKIHNVGLDNGSALFPVGSILDAMCTLNNDYEQSNIQFYIDGEIEILLNSEYNSHASVLDGAEMMFANNFDSTINVYFVTNPAGNCGYNLPYAGIAMSKGCSGIDDHTMAHEVGHNLKVQHPHLGWDGNVYNPGEPTPLTTTYDYTYFKDTLILDTLIIDTSIVEFADRSNCAIAGDFMCDTGADYLSSRWQCTDSGQSTTSQTDPQGDQFRSDASLFMSYAVDECSYRFTEEQTALMRSDLLSQKFHFLNQREPLDPIDEEITLDYPIEDEIVDYNAVEFAWDAIANADKYVMEISRFPNFTLNEFTTVTDTNYILVESLNNNRRYFWRARAYNDFSFCPAFTDPESFETSDFSATNEELLSNFTIYPSPIRAGQDVIVEAVAQNFTIPLQMSWIDLQGRITSVVAKENAAKTYISTSELEAGTYILQIAWDGQVAHRKIQILK